MPTDDVPSSDETPRPFDPADDAEPSTPPLRAMSLSDLDPDPEPEEKHRRLTRREVRARREREREERRHAEEAAAASAGGAAEADETASEAAHAPKAPATDDETRELVTAPDEGEPTVAMDAVPDAPASPRTPEPEPVRTEAPAAAGPAALAWVDPTQLKNRQPAPAAEDKPLVPVRRRRVGSVIAPIATALLIAAAYVVACAVWPLNAIAPTVHAEEVEALAGPDLSIDWPSDGGAAVAAVGADDAILSSSDEERPLASITKLASVLMVLDEQPLEVGEEGPSYDFTADDEADYWGYVERGESRLEVPVDGSLTQYELMEGILIGSANNWASRLVSEVFGSTDEFVAAAETWLDEQGLDSMTLVEPTGIDWNNTASPSDIARLGEIAMENPVIAEIVQKKEVDLPGPGVVENTNDLLADEGVVGIKTGTLLDNSNLVVAKELPSGDDGTVTVVASILGQPDDESRDIVGRSLLDQAEAAVEPSLVLPAETVVAKVTTAWGESATAVTPEDVSLATWDGETPAVSAPTVEGAIGQGKGDVVGTLTVKSTLASADVDVQLTDAIEGPDFWWRLTHPLALLGLG